MKKDPLTPSLTIVGGQPNRRRRSSEPVQVPVGVEKLLYLAAQDAAFKKKLLRDRPAALAASGVTLRPSETSMLTAISNRAIEKMIAGIVPENPKRRRFMGLVAAAAASIVAGTVDTGCSSESVGISPNIPEEDLDSGTDTSSDSDSSTDTDTSTDSDTVDIIPDGGGVDAGITGDAD
ncbi:MAG: hypothetical protein QNJ97_16395 [Myxococcota bacterium]|nr:hypothetical protein [Myxococcota bacterium]